MADEKSIIQDIPKEYMEKVIEKYKETSTQTINYAANGRHLNNEGQLREAFQDQKNEYLGIEINNYMGLNSFTSGVKLPYSQTLKNISRPIEYEYNPYYPEHTFEENNGFHRGTNIIIIEVPKKYELSDSKTDDKFAGFYYQDKDGSMQVRPEFIRGVYSTQTNEFIENENYYMNLKKEDQERLFDDVIQNYAKILSSNGLNQKTAIGYLPQNISNEEFDKFNIDYYALELEREKKFEGKDIDESLNKIVAGMSISKINETTGSIRKNVERSQEKGKENKENEVKELDASIII